VPETPGTTKQVPEGRLQAALEAIGWSAFFLGLPGFVFAVNGFPHPTADADQLVLTIWMVVWPIIGLTVLVAVAWGALTRSFPRLSQRR
jgi:hypothetical protein